MQILTDFIQHISCIFFLYVFFSHEHLQIITGQKGKGDIISLIPPYHFHPLHKHLYINRAITAESSSLHIASRWTQTRNPSLPSASH